jgi:predicted acylesterase/phospholipase RssA
VASIAVAISGGGHRAALFGLGALMYLVDAEQNRSVTSVSSVSGGSLTNAVVAQRSDYRTVDAATFEGAVRPFAQRLAQRGTVLSWWGTWLYLGGCVAGFAASVAIWWGPWWWGWRLTGFLIAFLAWSELLRQRGRVCGRAFAETVFQTEGERALLAGIQRSIDHVFCATDLHAGEHVYFSGSFVCAYEFGWGVPGDLPLDAAVQASAALPGAFPVRWLPTARHGFKAGRHQAARMALTDGGVYDNMADQWPQEVAKRKDRWSGLADDLKEPTELIVVNASAPLAWGTIGRFGWPIAGDLLALLRCKDVLYDNTTTLRRAGLVGRFDRAALQGSGLRGALVHIPQSPFDVPKAFEGSTDWPDRSERAAAALVGLAGQDEDEWDLIAAQDSQVKTSLSKMGTEVAARLIRHAYVLAMCNLHVILGYELLDVPTEERFLELVS